MSDDEVSRYRHFLARFSARFTGWRHLLLFIAHRLSRARTTGSTPFEEFTTMFSSYHIALIASSEVDRHVQERIQQAERYALVQSIRRAQPSKSRAIRQFIGNVVVQFGRKIDGRHAVQPERWIDVPEAVRTAR
jgi:hypothetical protein